MLAVGEKYGCLEIMDEGEEHKKVIDTQIAAVEDEKKEFLNAVQEGKLEERYSYDMTDGSKSTVSYVYIPHSFKVSYTDGVIGYQGP